MKEQRAGTTIETPVLDNSRAIESGRTLLIFSLADEFCGLPVSLVREIVHVPPRITRVPNAPAYVRGVINLRGTVIPVLDCACKMGNFSLQNSIDSRIVVIEFEDTLFGILVDVVREVRTVPDSLVESTDVDQNMGAIGTDYVMGVAKMEDGRLIVLLDLVKLFAIDELLQEDL